MTIQKAPIDVKGILLRDNRRASSGKIVADHPEQAVVRQ